MTHDFPTTEGKAELLKLCEDASDEKDLDGFGRYDLALAAREAIPAILAENARQVEEIEGLKRERDESKRSAKYWEEDVAAQFYRNTEYYRGICDQIGATYGEAAYIQDDGGRCDDILRAKLPELALAMANERDAAIAHAEKAEAAQLECVKEASAIGRQLGEAQARTDALAAQVEMLETALKPFAQVAVYDRGNSPVLTDADFNAARSALITKAKS